MTNTTEDVAERVRTYLGSGPAAGTPVDELPDDYPLLDEVLDSLGVYSLVGFLERTFGIRIADDELMPENFETIASIVAFVRTKRLHGEQ